MAAIKGRNTKPVMLVRKFLHANGYRYSLLDKKLPGKPDIACLPAGRRILPKYRTVIFVHGCSWHRHLLKARIQNPDLLLRKYLHTNGYRYKLHDKKLPVNFYPLACRIYN